MALVQTDYLQSKKYSALRDRLTLMHGGAVQQGAWAAGDFLVVQHAGSANMSVDVAAGFALIAATDASNAGLYHQESNSLANPSFSASHATLPRIDQVILTANDSVHGGDATDDPILTVLTGTATSGATLDNRNGAATLPNSTVRFADVLIPAASTTVVTANIRDRRPWARGAFSRLVRTAGNLTTASGTQVQLSSALQQRIECSGAPVRLGLQALAQHSTAASFIGFQPVMDGVAIDSVGDYGAVTVNTAGGAVSYEASVEYIFMPAAGSHLLEWYWRTGAATATLLAGAGSPTMVVVEELVRQNANNS